MTGFVLLYWKDGHYSIVKDYGDHAWNSPQYEMVGWFNGYQNAVKARQIHKRCRTLKNRG